MYLFLDFDGVLHADFAGNEYFCHVPKLVDALAEFPDVRIVISSTWRLNRSVDELRGLLGPALGSRVVGVTPELKGNEYAIYRRQNEIEAWLEANAKPWDDWIALDDMSSDFTPFCQHLISTHGEVGIYDADIALLRLYLVHLHDCKDARKAAMVNTPTDGEL